MATKTIHHATAMAVLATAVLTACGTAGSGTGPAPGHGCAAAAPTVAAETPTVAVLAETGPSLAGYQKDITTVLAAAASGKAHVIVNGVTAGPDAPNLVADVVLVGEGHNNLERTTNLNCKTAAVDAALTTLKEKAPTQAPPNAFDAISTLSGNLDRNPSKQPVDVVLMTSLRAKAGPVDLNDPATLADPVAAINTLTRNGLIPSCAGYRFYAVSPATGVDDVEVARLRKFWTLYAQKCGGELVAWTDHLATFPVTSAITPVDESPIAVQRTDDTVTATLGSDVLFDADSAVLRPAAEPALTALLDLTERYAGPIVVTGYVNPVVPGSSTASDQALSEQRAGTVAAWLVRRGVDTNRIRTVGKGAGDAVNPVPRTEAERAANRRVVAVIHTAAG